MIDYSNKGLYIHVPFCHRICHYCDFAKTANFSSADIQNFILKIKNDIRLFLPKIFGIKASLGSVFFGGGTPSLLGKHLSEILVEVAPYLHSDAEISLEVNPEDITLPLLQSWSSAGVNRISLGVQSFDDEGLKYLTRSHSGRAAERAVETAASVISNINVDLIFGWANQCLSKLDTDLRKAHRLGVSHISFYNLTFEGNTVFARRQKRGILRQMDEELEERFYNYACELLTGFGFEHEEVSNFSKPGYSCKHNWLYWSEGQYLGFGPGAHSFIMAEGHPFGLRYSIPFKMKNYLSDFPKVSGLREMLDVRGYLVENRDGEDWIIEKVWAGLRTKRGVNTQDLSQRAKVRFSPTNLINWGIDNGKLVLTSDGFLHLEKAEWFRETYWATEVTRCFTV